MKKTWIEKFNQSREKMIKVLKTNFSEMKVGEKMLIATPKIIDDYINQVPKSYTVDMKSMRKNFALTESSGCDLPCYNRYFFENSIGSIL